jgi:protocatechuate 3,4-dioxygenase beta subunit
MELFSEERSAQVVASSFAHTPDPRLRQLLTALTRHLHAFVKEVELTGEEWGAAVDFLTRTGQKCDDVQQGFVLLSDVLGVSMLVETINHRAGGTSTESTVLGPFHMVSSPPREPGDNIALDGKGEPCLVTGRVTGPDSEPLAGALVDVWQADADGFYDVQQPDVQPERNLRGLFTADHDGRFWFRTIGDWDVTIERDNNTSDNPTGRRAKFRFQLDGPNSSEIFDAVVEGDTPEIKFFRTARVRIAGVEVLVLRHGMAGHKGVEISGPYEHGEKVRAAILAAGAEHGLRQGGTKAYFSTLYEQVLEELAPNPPHKKMTLVWNADDVLRIVGSLLEPGVPYKYLELPVADYGNMIQRDEVRSLDGTFVGLSTYTGYSINERKILSIALLDAEHAVPGEEVTILWGEPDGGSRKPRVELHQQTLVHATVASASYAAAVQQMMRGERATDRMLAGPERQLEVVWLADILLDAVVRRQTQRPDQRAVLPDREPEPVDARTHPVQDDPPAPPLRRAGAPAAPTGGRT